MIDDGWNYMLAYSEPIVCGAKVHVPPDFDFEDVSEVMVEEWYSYAVLPYGAEHPVTTAYKKRLN